MISRKCSCLFTSALLPSNLTHILSHMTKRHIRTVHLAYNSYSMPILNDPRGPAFFALMCLGVCDVARNIFRSSSTSLLDFSRHLPSLTLISHYYRAISHRASGVVLFTHVYFVANFWVDPLITFGDCW